MSRRLAFACGIASSLLYVAVNVVGPLRYPGYDPISQAVSELSAIGSPTRPLFVAVGIPYNLLVLAFAWGVWRAGTGNAPLRAAGASLAAFAVVGLASPFTPMHVRGETFGFTDTLHIAATALTVLFMLLAIGFGAASLGARFRVYSIATLVVHLVFGAWAAADGPRLARGLPTPWIGVTERINIGAFLLWVVVLAMALLRAPGHARPRPGIAPAPAGRQAYRA